ncbi:sulfite exporter TauE/SafE family protein 2-like [Corylus avellana]|uniref:sulfite exporter TauE/SafE family protein 2-like n=1 Tax=Corylus avellana TaxID=13451 RepID=UPI001E1F6F39|nr:sulfite exporter TauE/SafE family protein 2-like [Corylus avellana]
MKNHSTLSWFILPLILFITFNHSHAKQTESISNTLRIEHLLNKFYQWRSQQTQENQLKLATPVVVAGVLCFIAASISSAGGIGGGGLFIPILTIVAGVDLKTASSLSAFMVTGGSVANVMCNLRSTCPKYGGRTLIDFDIALLSEPCMLLGVSIGVICNLVFPEWLITMLFATFLAWSTSKTCKNGVLHWKMESEELKRNGCETLEKRSDESEGIEATKEPLLGVKGDCKLRFPWMKMGVLVLVWFSFFTLYLLRGNRQGQGIIEIEPCGAGYWIISSLQIPLAMTFTAWILCKKDIVQHQASNHEDEDQDLIREGPSNKLIFPNMALLAGILGGVFGIGGGMLISPLLLHVGIAPEVTAATCSFMVFFSSTMSAFQYVLLGMEHTDAALIFAIICCAASFLGLVVVQRAIQEYGRASLIVFSVSIVMALSTVLMTTFGAVDVWRSYVSGKYMGFKLPC